MGWYWQGLCCEVFDSTSGAHVPNQSHYGQGHERCIFESMSAMASLNSSRDMSVLKVTSYGSFGSVLCHLNDGPERVYVMPFS